MTIELCFILHSSNHGVLKKFDCLENNKIELYGLPLKIFKDKKRLSRIMRRISVLILSFCFCLSSRAQSLHLGVFGGVSNYQGDLVDKIYLTQNTKAAGSILAYYELAPHWTLRGAFTFTKLTANDAFNSEALRLRNLSFATSLSELSVVGEYATFNPDEKRWTPYLFGGVALFHFDPYTKGAAGEKTFLKPLSTEGQGLAGYENVTPYARTQAALPAGAGVRFAVNDKLRIGVEFCIRKLFTDYLDDVSSAYAGAADLLRERGPVAVAFAYRGDEVPGGNPLYPEKGAQRGGASQKDYFYTAGFTLSFRLPGRGSGFSGGRSRRGYGCPASPL